MAVKLTDEHKRLIPRLVDMASAGISKYSIANELNLTTSQLNALLRSRFEGLEPYTVGEHIEKVKEGSDGG